MSVGGFLLERLGMSNCIAQISGLVNRKERKCQFQIDPLPLTPYSLFGWAFYAMLVGGGLFHDV